MKTNHLKALVAALVLTSYAGFAAAAGTQTVAVTASVKAVCKFGTAAAPVDFGVIDPSVGGELTKVITVPYKCTKGVTPSVTAGTISALSDGTNSIAFTVDAFDPGAGGTGFSAEVNATSTARIAQTAYQDAPASTYSGSVVVDINN